jgi:hypothetical protein
MLKCLRKVLSSVPRGTPFFTFPPIYPDENNPLPNVILYQSILAKIIGHLKLSFQAKRPAPSHVAHQDLLIVTEVSVEYF